MTSKKAAFPDDKTAPERRKGLSDAEIKDLELAGGIEGGMQAGRGGPRPKHEDNRAEPGKSGAGGAAQEDSGT